MNILIVDDETIIREWLQHTMQSLEGLGIHADTASDGIEALEKLQQTSYNVIFIDIQMPRMNGIDLIREIRTINKEILIVILSSHDEFDYAREVMRNGAFEYILKSECDKNSLKKLLSRCQYQLDNSHSDLSTLIHTFLTNALNYQEPDIETEQLQSLFSAWEKKYYFAAAFSWDDTAAIDLSKQFHIYSDLFSFISPDFISLGEVNKIYYYLFEWRHYEGRNNFHEVLLSFLQKLCDQYPQLKAGYSQLHYGLLDLVSSLQEAFFNHERLFYGGSPYIIPESVHENVPVKEFSRLHADLIQDIRTYDNQKFFHDLRHFEEWVMNYKPKVRLLKESYNDLLYSLYLYYCEDTAVLSDLSAQMKKEILHAVSFADLKKYAWSIIRHYVLSLPAAKKYSSHVEAALAYIAEYYADISSVKEIADHIHLNTDYLARLFKKETGRNINTYLMDYKLDIASYMLKTTNLQISEIALNVGIPNISYFSKKFRERYELQPVNYRAVYR